MEKLAAETDAVRKKNFTLEFTIPTGSQLEKLRMIHRERTAAEYARIEKAQNGLTEFLNAVQRGDLLLEGLPPHLRTQLAKLMSSMAVDPDDL